MRLVKVLAVVMGVMIVIGTTVVVVTIIKRATSGSPGGSPGANIAVVLEEPAGTSIRGIAALSDRVAVLMQGAGPDRIVLIDPRTGLRTGTIALAH